MNFNFYKLIKYLTARRVTPVPVLWWPYWPCQLYMVSPSLPVIIIPVIIIIHLWELFTSALADGFSLESEWQWIPSSLQDSSQHSGRFQ